MNADKKRFLKKLDLLPKGTGIKKPLSMWGSTITIEKDGTKSVDHLDGYLVNGIDQHQFHEHLNFYQKLLCPFEYLFDDTGIQYITPDLSDEQTLPNTCVIVELVKTKEDVEEEKLTLIFWMDNVPEDDKEMLKILEDKADWSLAVKQDISLFGAMP